MIYIKKGYECLKLLSPFLITCFLIMMMILSSDSARTNTKTIGKKSITALQANQFKIIGEFK